MRTADRKDPAAALQQNPRTSKATGRTQIQRPAELAPGNRHLIPMANMKLRNQPRGAAQRSKWPNCAIPGAIAYANRATSRNETTCGSGATICCANQLRKLRIASILASQPAVTFVSASHRKSAAGDDRQGGGARHLPGFRFRIGQRVSGNEGWTNRGRHHSRGRHRDGAIPHSMRFAAAFWNKTSRAPRHRSAKRWWQAPFSPFPRS